MTPGQMNARMFATLSQIQRDVAEIKGMMARGGGSSSAPTTSGGGATEGAVADESDLFGDHGDPTIKYDLKEKYWTGQPYAGYRFSQCPPDYLDAMAKYLDACAYMAEKDPDESKRKNARYKRKDAARARGWAKRIRERGHVAAPINAGGAGGGLAPPEPGGGYSGNDDDIPF